LKEIEKERNEALLRWQQIALEKNQIAQEKDQLAEQNKEMQI